MSNYASIYWLTRLDTIFALSITLIVIAFIIILIYVIGYSETWNGEERKAYISSHGKWKRRSIGMSITGTILVVFLPTQKDLITIIAGGKTINFIQSDTSINKIPSQTTAIISNFLEKQLNQIDSAKSKKK